MQHCNLAKLSCSTATYYSCSTSTCLQLSCNTETQVQISRSSTTQHLAVLQLRYSFLLVLLLSILQYCNLTAVLLPCNFSIAILQHWSLLSCSTTIQLSYLAVLQLNATYIQPSCSIGNCCLAVLQLTILQNCNLSIAILQYCNVLSCSTATYLQLSCITATYLRLFCSTTNCYLAVLQLTYSYLAVLVTKLPNTDTPPTPDS